MDKVSEGAWLRRLRHELGSVVEVAVVGLLAAGLGVLAVAGFYRTSHFVLGLLGVHHRPLPAPLGEVGIPLLWLVVLVGGFIYGLRRRRQLMLLSVVIGWVISVWVFANTIDMFLGGKPRSPQPADWSLFLSLVGCLAFPFVTMRGQKRRLAPGAFDIFSPRTVAEVAVVGFASASIGTLAANGLFRTVNLISGVPGITHYAWPSPIEAVAWMLLWVLPVGGALLYGLRRRRRSSFLSVWMGWWIGWLLVVFMEVLSDSIRSAPDDSLYYVITFGFLALLPALVTMYGQKRRTAQVAGDARE